MPAFISIDILIILGIFLLFFLIAFKLGKSFLATFIVAFYPAYLIFTHLAFASGKETLLKVGIFTGLYAICFIVCGRLISTSFSFLRVTKILQQLLLSVACASIIVFFHYHIVSLSEYHDFGSQIDTLFTATVPLVVWLAFPIVALFISSRD